MTKQEAINKLMELNRGDDVQIEHMVADDVLCDLLVSLGYEDVIAEYKKIQRWFA